MQKVLQIKSMLQIGKKNSDTALMLKVAGQCFSANGKNTREAVHNLSHRIVWCLHQHYFYDDYTMYQMLTDRMLHLDRYNEFTDKLLEAYKQGYTVRYSFNDGTQWNELYMLNDAIDSGINIKHIVLEKKDDTSKLIFGWGPGKTILYIHDNNGLAIHATDSWRSITITKIEEQLAEYILNNRVRFD